MDLRDQFDDPPLDEEDEAAVTIAEEGQEVTQEELLQMGKLWFGLVSMLVAPDIDVHLLCQQLFLFS